MSDPTTRGPGQPEDFGPPGEPVTQTELDLEPKSSGGLPGWARVAAVIAAVAVAGAAALAYRSHHRKKVLREGLARAQSLLRADTFAGYREASRLLEPLSKLDPVEAGAMRAFALAALFADYRDPKASAEAEGLLIEPGRAAEVPEGAQLAYAALALGRMEVGNAAGFAARTRSATGLTFQARTSLAAGNLGAAAEPLARAVQADPTLPMALALSGDVQRRSGIGADALRSTGSFPGAARDGLVLAEAASLASLATEGAKDGFARRRPGLPTSGPASPAGNHSLWSGHTSLAFSIAVAQATQDTLRGDPAAPWAWAVGLTLASAVGYLRVAGDAHWLSDVLAGAVAGSAFGVAVPLAEKRLVGVTLAPAPGGIAIRF